MIKSRKKLHIGEEFFSSRHLAIAWLALLSFFIPGHLLGFKQELTFPGMDYRIGPNDLLEISVFGMPELHQTARVSEDGSISLTLIGKVEVVKLTAQELEKKLASILNEKFTKEAHVTVFIKEYQKVAVLGAVGKPGMYELVGPTNLVQIIAQAGGLTSQAANKLFIYRQENDGRKTTLTVPLEELMSNGNQDYNFTLHPKDVINIPIDQTLNVFVFGEVKKPGGIPFLRSKKITVLQAITQAGGLNDWANTRSVVIKRKEKNTGNEMSIEVSLNRILDGKSPDVALEDGDIVIIS